MNESAMRLLAVAESTLANCQRLDGSDPEELQDLRAIVNEIKTGGL